MQALAVPTLVVKDFGADGTLGDLPRPRGYRDAVFARKLVGRSGFARMDCKSKDQCGRCL